MTNTEQSCPSYREILNKVLEGIANKTDKTELYLDITENCCAECKHAAYFAVFELEEGQIRYILSPKRDLRNRLYYCPTKERREKYESIQQHLQSRMDSQVDRRNK